MTETLNTTWMWTRHHIGGMRNFLTILIAMLLLIGAFREYQYQYHWRANQSEVEIANAKTEMMQENSKYLYTQIDNWHTLSIALLGVVEKTSSNMDALFKTISERPRVKPVRTFNQMKAPTRQRPDQTGMSASKIETQKFGHMEVVVTDTIRPGSIPKRRKPKP